MDVAVRSAGLRDGVADCPLVGLVVELVAGHPALGSGAVLLHEAGDPIVVEGGRRRALVLVLSRRHLLAGAGVVGVVVEPVFRGIGPRVGAADGDP